MKPCHFTEADIHGRTLWVILSIILAVGVFTRFLYLDQIYLFIDETPYIENWWRDYGSSFRGFLKGVWKLSLENYGSAASGHNGLWTAVVYTLCKTVGTPTLWWGRFPAALSSILFLPVVFVLTRLISGSNLAGLFVAAAATVSITQIYHAQQILDYGPTVLASSLILWSTIAGYERLRLPSARAHFIPNGFFFFLAVTAGAVFHNATLPVIFACFTYLLGSMLWLWYRSQIKRSDAIFNLATLFQTGVMILGCLIVFVLPKFGFGYREYLAPYYAPKCQGTGGVLSTAIAMVSFGLKRAYDLATYALNPVYNDRWYQPLGLNPLLILPIMVMFMGAVHLWRKGGKERGLVVLALGTLSLVFLGAFFGKYPLGGVRPCLPLTVFVYVFVGVGMWVIYQKWKVVAIGLMVLWIAVCLWALPQFYTKRLSPFNTELLVHYARLSGTRLIVTVNDWGCPEDVIFKYYLRDHSKIEVVPLWNILEGLRREERPFLLASTTTNLHRYKAMYQSGAHPRNKEGKAFVELLSEKKLKISPLVEVGLNPVNPDKWQYEFLSIYTPLNGLFLYKVDWEGTDQNGKNKAKT